MNVLSLLTVFLRVLSNGYYSSKLLRQFNFYLCGRESQEIVESLNQQLTAFREMTTGEGTEEAFVDLTEVSQQRCGFRG